MQVGVLGPLVVIDGDGPVPIAGAKLQALVAMLALNAGQVVSTDRLMELLWADDQPGGAANALQSRVSKLRRLLGRERVVMRSNGYVLEVEPAAVDALAFATSVAEGRAALARGEVAEAARCLRDGLGLWRGEALVDVGGDGFFQLEAARLGELRWSAIEDRVEADLVLGRHQELAGELVGLVEAQPLRERLRGQAMLALYRSGRQAEALATFRRAREVFAEELGLDPGPELQALEVAILRQAPELAPAPAGAAPGPTPTATSTATSTATAMAPSAGSRSPRLRRPLTSFVGRDGEVDAIRARLVDDRLVTLTGPGGTGKTRLAIEAAADEQDGAPPRTTGATAGSGTERPERDVWVVEQDGASPRTTGGAAGSGADRPERDVWVVELAPVADPASVPDAIAAALDLPGERSAEGWSGPTPWPGSSPTSVIGRRWW